MAFHQFLLVLLLIPASRTDDNCLYNCKDRGGCSVMWRGRPRAGFTLGYCTAAGRCVSTPPECRECDQECGLERGQLDYQGYHHNKVSWEDHYGFRKPNSEPVLPGNFGVADLIPVPPAPALATGGASIPQISAVVAEEEEDEFEEDGVVVLAGPPSPPPSPVFPPAPPSPAPPAPRPTTTTTRRTTTTTRKTTTTTTSRPRPTVVITITDKPSTVRPTGPPRPATTTTTTRPAPRPSTARPQPPPGPVTSRPVPPPRPRPTRPSRGPLGFLKDIIYNKIQWKKEFLRGKLNFIRGVFRKGGRRNRP